MDQQAVTAGLAACCHRLNQHALHQVSDSYLLCWWGDQTHGSWYVECGLSCVVTVLFGPSCVVTSFCETGVCHPLWSRLSVGRVRVVLCGHGFLSNGVCHSVWSLFSAGLECVHYPVWSRFSVGGCVTSCVVTFLWAGCVLFCVVTALCGPGVCPPVWSPLFVGRVYAVMCGHDYLWAGCVPSCVVSAICGPGV